MIFRISPRRHREHGESTENAGFTLTAPTPWAILPLYGDPALQIPSVCRQRAFGPLRRRGSPVPQPRVSTRGIQRGRAHTRCCRAPDARPLQPQSQRRAGPRAGSFPISRDTGTTLRAAPYLPRGRSLRPRDRPPTWRAEVPRAAAAPRGDGHDLDEREIWKTTEARSAAGPGRVIQGRLTTS